MNSARLKFPSESVSGINRNQCPLSIGMGVRIRPEYSLVAEGLVKWVARRGPHGCKKVQFLVTLDLSPMGGTFRGFCDSFSSYRKITARIRV